MNRRRSANAAGRSIRRSARGRGGQHGLLPRESSKREGIMQRIELRASNPEVGPIFVAEGQSLEIYGVLVGMYRRYNL